MKDMNRDAALGAIEELADKQTAIGLRVARLDNRLAQEVHESNMAWRSLALKLGGIEIDGLELLARHLTEKGE